MANNTLTYGFHTLKNLAAERVTTVGEKVVLDAVNTSAKYHTDMLNSILGSVVQRTTDHKWRYRLSGGGTLQPIGTSGNPVPVRESGYYDVALPIRGGATAWATDRVARALMTVDEANRLTLESLRRDADWMKRNFLAALFTNTSWTYADDVFGSLTIQPLANGDVTFTLVGGTTEASNHYLAQAAAIDDSNNPYDDIYDKLMKHPANQGADVVVFIPTNLKATTQALTNFVEVGDPDVELGANAAKIAANVGGHRLFGDEVLGKVEKCWIVEWKQLPSSYMIAFAVGAPAVIGMREYPAESLQGFFTENDAGDGNITKTKMIRYAGFGVLNRVGAVVQRIGNGTYAIPSGYTAPLPA